MIIEAGLLISLLARVAITLQTDFHTATHRLIRGAAVWGVFFVGDDCAFAIKLQAGTA
jgi:hypothetical protein